LALDIFKFKQFKVGQNQNVHRVGTDGVLLGAWVNLGSASHILDIGTGTGVIALMLAQRSDAKITGIDSDQEAFRIARQNAEESPWKERIRIMETSLQDFYTEARFDLAVCNPPFFENSLKPPTSHRQQQRHTDTLPQDQLIENVTQLLTPTGRLAVVLPTAEGNRFRGLAKTFNLYLHRSCAVFSKMDKPQERWLLEFGFTPMVNTNDTQLIIIDSAGQWTDEYRALTRDFYLNF
jgi:tRNA1Val (adenine37-N6)-methyltransferase